MLSQVAADIESDTFNREYDMYSQLLAGDAMNPDFWYQRSRVVQKNSGCVGKLVFAVADLRRALALCPNNKAHLADLQDTLRRLGQNADRLAVLHRLIELEGQHSAYAAIVTAIESGHNEKMAVLRWAENNSLASDSWLDPGVWSYEQVQDQLVCEYSSQQAHQDFGIFLDGRIMNEYADIIKRYVRTTVAGIGELRIQADIVSRIHQRPRQLLRHVNIVPDGPFHFVLIDQRENAVASAGFSFCCTNGNTEITVDQLQGTPGAHEVLGSVRWEHLLLGAIEQFAVERQCAAVRVLSSESNPWVERMHRWMIERDVIPESLSLKSLFGERDLMDRARNEWNQWWDQEAKHPYFTRYIGFVDIGKALLRYDKTARRRHYRPCKGADGAMKYWRKVVGS
jgi:hypothetical protein